MTAVNAPEASHAKAGAAEPPKRFEGDQLLRRFGWRIYKRGEGQEPIWERNGYFLPHRDALAVVRKELKKVERNKGGLK